MGNKNLTSAKSSEKAMAPHSSTLAWKIPWTEGLQSMGSKSRTRLSEFTFTFHFHALEKEMATHSSVLAWRIPGTAEPGVLPSMGSHRVRHDWSDLAAAAAVTKGIRTILKRWTWEEIFLTILLNILHSFISRQLSFGGEYAVHRTTLVAQQWKIHLQCRSHRRQCSVPGLENPLESMATLFSILAWRIP